VLSYGVHDLQEAGVLPGLDSIAFDVSAQVPPGSWYGTLLKGTINFSPVTTWLELAAWSAYIVPVMSLFQRVVRRPHAPGPADTATRAERVDAVQPA
jgi:high-affinity iron transporter